MIVTDRHWRSDSITGGGERNQTSISSFFRRCCFIIKLRPHAVILKVDRGSASPRQAISTGLGGGKWCSMRTRSAFGSALDKSCAEQNSAA